LADRAPLPVALDVSVRERLPDPVEAAAYYVVAEALTNVAKYAHASGVTIDVTRENGHARIEVRDDGVGGAVPGRGSGLRGLAARWEPLGGELVLARPAGPGPTLRATIPCGCPPASGHRGALVPRRGVRVRAPARQIAAHPAPAEAQLGRRHAVDSDP